MSICCSLEIPSRWKEKAKVIKDLITVLLSSIIGQIYDTIKDWYLVITLLLYGNYAWGTLFSLPILYGYLGQGIMCYHEEIRNEFERKSMIWKIFPFYGIFRSIDLLIKIFRVLFLKSKAAYDDEKRRIDARINPIELFNESLPQLLLLNCAVSGLIINGNMEDEKKEEAIHKGYQQGITFFITNYFTSHIVDSYGSLFSRKQMKLEDIPSIYNKTEINTLIEHTDIFSVMYYTSYCFAFIGLLQFMFDGPVPLMSVKQKRLKTLIKEKGLMIGILFSTWEALVLIASVVYFTFGPLRQIAIFNLLMGIYYINEDGTVIDYRGLFWIKIGFYIVSMVFPAILIQYYFLNKKNLFSTKISEGIFMKIPFIYSIPVFTGVFTSVKQLKRYRIRNQENGSNIDHDYVLQMSDMARNIYQFVRIIIVTSILILIWTLTNLKVVRLEYFVYMHMVNIVDIVSLTGKMVSRRVHHYIVEHIFTRWGEDVKRKYGVYHPSSDHDCTYELDKIIGRFMMKIILLSSRDKNNRSVENIRINTVYFYIYSVYNNK